MLELRDLVKHYHTAGEETVRAVDGVSLSVATGEMVALYGPSGSGKTTLLLMVAALLAPDQRRGACQRARHLLALRARGIALQTAGNGVRAPELRPVAGRDGDRQHGAQAAQETLLGRRPTSACNRCSSGSDWGAPDAPLGDALDGRAPARDDRQGACPQSRSCSWQTSLPAASTRSAGARCLELLTELCRERGVAIVLVSHDPQAAGYADRVLALRDGRLVDYDPEQGFAPTNAR